MVKVCSIGVNVLCERASILARGSLGRAPFRTAPLAARHPLIRIRVFNLARRAEEGRERRKRGIKGGGETENGNGRIGAPRGNKLAELPWCTTRVNSASFFSLPLFPSPTPSKVLLYIFSGFRFDIGWNKVKLWLFFFERDGEMDRRFCSKVKSGIGN